MKEKNKYKVNDFLRYIKGEMTNSERHSFEKESQKDPFTEEALDGLETISPEAAEKDMKRLKSKLNRRVRRRQRFTLYRIAASLAVLMIISSVFIVIEKNNSIEQESVPEYRSVTMDIAKSEPVFKPEKKEESLPVSEARKEASDISGSATVQQPAVSDIVDDREENIREMEPVMQEEIQSSKKEVAKAVRRTPENKQIIPEGLAESRNAAAVRSRIMTDSADLPAEKEAQIQTSDGYLPPQPVDGNEAFNKYISENLIRPDSATAGQRVVVVASFKVLSDGTIDSIKIIRSPGKEFSDEAIRLIKSGPSWKPAMRDGIAVEEDVRLRIVFP